jgi:hypothetical protein
MRRRRAATGPSRWAIFAISATGSIEVVEVVPIVPTRAIGLVAGRAILGDGASRASIRSSELVVGRDAHERRDPNRASCTPSRSRNGPRRSVDAQFRYVGAAGRPRAAASVPAASRAAASAIMDDIEALSVSKPSKPAGSPRAWRNQSTTTCSSSVPTGLVRHSITLEFRAAASISPMIPGPDAALLK